MVTVFSQKRCIACHAHHIGVALHVAEEECFGQRRLQRTRSRSVFSDIHFRTLAVVMVVIVQVVHKPSCALVVVFVHHVDDVVVLFGKLPTLYVVGRRIVERPCRAAHDDVGILLLNGLAYHETTLLKGRGDDVFVAHTDVFEVERSRMSCVCPHLRPLGGCRISVGPLYQIEKLLTIGWHVGHGDAPLLSAVATGVVGRVLAGNASGKHRQGLCADVFAELEILVEAQSACLVIVPDVSVRHAVFRSAYGVVPMVDVVESVSVAHAAARKPHKLRF